MKNLFVGNLTFQATEADVRAQFEPYGQVSRVHIATDRDTGRSRGFAFVEMPNDEEAKRAMTELDGKPMDGRPLKVNEARPRPPRSGGGGGGSKFGSGGGGRVGRGGRGGYSGESYRDGPFEKREPRW